MTVELRNYGHESEFIKFSTFKQNIDFIENFEAEYDEGLHHSEVEINEFADLSN